VSRRVVLVTGGAGYVGSHVCKALDRAGFLPVTYDNLTHGHAWAVKWGPIEKGCLLDGQLLRDVMRRYRPVAVAHLAGLIAVGESVTNPLIYWRHNVEGSLSLLAAMHDCGIDRLVFSSTCAIYGAPRLQPIDESAVAAPLSPYAWTKLAVEQMLRDCAHSHGLKWVALRYFNAAGADPDGDVGEAHAPETHLIPIVLEAAAGLRPAVTVFGQDYPTPDGTCLRDYVHVSDIADAHLLALDYLDHGHPCRPFNLGSGTGYSVQQVIATAEKVTGRPVPVIMGQRRPGDPSCLVGQCHDARHVLGWRPKFADLSVQIEHAWAWMQSRNKG